jgi:dihydroorotase
MLVAAAVYHTHRCAGIFTGHAALELYAEIFDAAGALDTVCSYTAYNL